MFFLAAVISMLALALQGVLMASYYREEPLWAASYRGLSLGITMLPLLFFVPASDYARLGPSWELLFAACLAAALANWAQGQALRYLPVGIMVALLNVAIVLSVIVLSVFFSRDRISRVEYAWIAAILFFTCVLGFFRSRLVTPEVDSPVTGVAITLCGGIMLGAAFFMVVSASRASHPFLSAYLWEFGIGIVCAASALLRLRLGRGKNRLPSGRFIPILLAASPTAIGTALFVYAATLGPVQIVSAIGVCGVVVAAVLSTLINRESIESREWVATIGVVISIVGLRLAGGG